MHICAGIEYGDVHSDLCFESVDDTTRQMLHDALDEALDHMDSTAHFFVGGFN
jgi:phage terminase large subunit